MVQKIMEFVACVITVCGGCIWGCRTVFMPQAIVICSVICCAIAAVGCAIAVI